MPNLGTKKFGLYQRILELSKARMESLEETALALGVTTASIRAYKLNEDREARPKVMRRLVELETALRNPSSAAAGREPFESPSTMETASKKVHSIEAGPNTMQRLTRLQQVAEDNRADIIQIKRQLEQLIELLGQQSKEPEKRKRA